MSEATEALKVAAADKIAPQHYDETLGSYQVTKGKNGAVNMNIIESALPAGAATGAKQDVIIAATGAAADAEAPGNGSVIGILKRVRTLIGDSLATLGSAIGTKATLIAGSDGTNARAIKTNAAGEQLVSLSGSNGQIATVTNGKLDVNATATATFTDKYEVLVTRQTDFGGKTSGQTWDVPHRGFAKSNATSIMDPLANFTFEIATPSYVSIGTQDGSGFASVSAATVNTYPQFVFKFDVFTTAKRTPGVTTAIDVPTLRSILKTVFLTWIGYGNGMNAAVSTSGVILKIYNKTTSTWDAFGSHTASIPTAVSLVVTNFTDYIDDSGFINLGVSSTYPANGTVNSANLFTDYPKLEFTASANFLNDTGSVTMVDEQQLTGTTVTAGATTQAWINVDTSRCDEYAVAINPSTSHTYSVVAAAVGRDNAELDALADRVSLIASASQGKKRAARTKVPSRKVNVYVTNGDVADRTYYGRFLRYGVRGERQS